MRPTFANFADTYFQECPFQFIKLLTGDTSIKISTSFLSETSDVQIFHFHDPDSGRKVTFVDTPGFGFNASPNLDDTDILKRIADFLLRECVYLLDFNFLSNGNLEGMTRNES